LGQQQLLLVILVTIIVGIATVVAISTFTEAREAANLDAVRQDVLSIANYAQSYAMKPEMLGGGDSSFSNFTFRNIPFGADSIESTQGLIAINENGKYEITARGTFGIEVTAHPASRINGPMNFSSVATESGTVLIADISSNEIDWTDND